MWFFGADRRTDRAIYLDNKRLADVVLRRMATAASISRISTLV